MLMAPPGELDRGPKFQTFVRHQRSLVIGKIRNAAITAGRGSGASSGRRLVSPVNMSSKTGRPDEADGTDRKLPSRRRR